LGACLETPAISPHCSWKRNSPPRKPSAFMAFAYFFQDHLYLVRLRKVDSLSHFNVRRKDKSSLLPRTSVRIASWSFKGAFARHNSNTPVISSPPWSILERTTSSLLNARIVSDDCCRQIPFFPLSFSSGSWEGTYVLGQRMTHGSMRL
jgi:hypothetical protein